MAQSPDESIICTASADETLRFWRIFDRSSGSKELDKQNGKDNL